MTALSEELTAFIAMDRRHALAAGEELPAESRGCALFADISGFIGLSDALVSGFGLRRGSEELTALLNRVYDALISEVHRFRGSVLDFSGDGFLAWFADDDGSRAVSTALGLQSAMGKIAATDLPVSIGVKVGVEEGTAHRLVIGNPASQRLDLLAGDPIRRAAWAETQGEAGEILAGDSLVASLGDRLHLGEARPDEDHGVGFHVVSGLREPIVPCPWPELSRDLSEEELAPWLPRDVYRRLASGRGEFLGELRRATPLFLSFPEPDLDSPERTRTELDAFVCGLQETIDRRGGLLLSVTLGDKGAYAYASFGALRSFEDDAERALACAQELRADLAEDGQDVAIGVAAGRMCAGAYGGKKRRIFGVLGAPANLAARLMQAASPGEIYVESAVREAAAARFGFSELGALELKGMKEAVPAFRLESEDRPLEPAVHATPSTIVGRFDERSWLASRVESVLDGRNCAVFLEGEAGVGKSQLVRDTIGVLTSRGIRTHVTTADAIDRAAAYHPWRRIVHAVLDLDRAPADPEAARAWIIEKLPADEKLRVLAPLLDPLLPGDWPQTDATEEMTGSERSAALQDLLVALLSMHQGDEPLAIVVEDAHLMDSPSWSVARRVVQELGPVFLMLACRVAPGESRDDIATSDERALREDRGAEVRTLEAMPRDEITKLLCERLAVERVDDRIVDLIESRAQGHPLFTEEFAYALRDNGWLGIYGGDCELVSGRDASALDVLETVEGAITSRIDALPDTLQLCVKVASVLGESFSFDTLRDIYPEGSHAADLAKMMGRLVERDILRLEAREPELRYGFRHGLVQETAYERLLFAQRRALHARVAEWYEALPGDDAETRTPRTAHHWRLAGAHTRAVQCLDRAAQMALLQGAFPEAIGFIEQALATETEAGLAASVPNDERAARTATRQRVLGDAYYGLGQIVDAALHLEDALEAMGHPIPRGGLRTALGIAREAALQARNRLFGTSPRKRAGDTAATVVAADTVNQLVPIYFILTRMTSFLYVCLRALNLAEAGGEGREARKLVAEGLAVMSVVTSAARWRSVADRYRALGVSLAREIGDPRTLARVFQSTGLYLIGTAQIEAAAEGLAEGRSLLRERPGDRRRYEEITGVEAWLGTLQARYERGVESWLDIYDGAVRGGDRQSQAVALSGRAEHLFMLGRGDYLETCEKLLWEARELLPEQNDPVFDIHFHGLLASIRRRRGNPRDAMADLDRAAAIMAASEVLPSYGMVVYARVPELYLEMAEADSTKKGRRDLRDAGKRALSDLRRFAATWSAGSPRVSRCEGILARIDGNEERAKRAFEKSLSFAATHGMPYDEARARFELGESTQARAIFSQIGARYEHDLAAARAV